MWRPGIAEGKDVGAIIGSSAFGYAMSGGVIYLCGLAAANSLFAALEVATLVWLAGAVPILTTNYLFIKLDWHILLSHALGWGAMLIAGAAAAWLFGGWLH